MVDKHTPDLLYYIIRQKLCPSRVSVRFANIAIRAGLSSYGSRIRRSLSECREHALLPWSDFVIDPLEIGSERPIGNGFLSVAGIDSLLVYHLNETCNK